MTLYCRASHLDIHYSEISLMLLSVEHLSTLTYTLSCTETEVKLNRPELSELKLYWQFGFIAYI